LLKLVIYLRLVFTSDGAIRTSKNQLTESEEEDSFRL